MRLIILYKLIENKCYTLVPKHESYNRKFQNSMLI